MIKCSNITTCRCIALLVCHNGINRCSLLTVATMPKLPDISHIRPTQLHTSGAMKVFHGKNRPGIMCM